MKLTSASANKMLRRLNEEKEYWRSIEEDRHLYTAAVNEEPVIPEYDYAQVAAEIARIDRQVVRIKHAISLVNVTNTITVGGEELTIDSVLVRMAQLTQRKNVLDQMRKVQPKSRVQPGYGVRPAAPEYQYINYDMQLVQKDYEAADKEIADIQLALDHFNQTFEFELDLEQ